jgi:cation:H+ antiporter
MAWVIVQFLTSAGVIVAAGTALTRYADAIARLTKLGQLFVGILFLAAATSLPELVVDMSAVRLGKPDLAVGDLFGSSLANLSILGVLDLLHYSRGQALSRLSAAHALSAAMSISLTSLACVSILAGRRVHVPSILGVGIGPWAILVVFILGVRLVFYDQKALISGAVPKSDAGAAAAAEPGGTTGTLSRALLGYVISAGVIVVAGPFLARSAGSLAELTGLGDTFVGTALVALCTSLPELITSLTAIRMGAIDLAIGNLLGSNSFNMVLLIPLDLLQPGALLSGVSPINAITCVSVMLVTSVVITGQLYHAERRIRFIEPDAVLVLILSLASIVLIYYLR